VPEGRWLFILIDIGCRGSVYSRARSQTGSRTLATIRYKSAAIYSRCVSTQDFVKCLLTGLFERPSRTTASCVTCTWPGVLVYVCSRSCECVRKQAARWSVTKRFSCLAQQPPWNDSSFTWLMACWSLAWTDQASKHVLQRAACRVIR